jgi:alpha-1,6-mannosyltransferase
MKICDITQSYSDTSGGIRTYIDAKRKYIIENTPHEHIIIIPGNEDRIEIYDKYSIYHIKSPIIKSCEPYRFIYRLDKIVALLKSINPDVIELGSAYVLPWAAFLHKFFKNTLLIGYNHTDFPTAYIKPFFEQKFGKNTGQVSEKIAMKYASFIYKQMDATITSSKLFYQQLNQKGINNLFYIPLGVDIKTFNPKKRDENFRENINVDKDDILLVYSGRIDTEKRIEFMINIFRQLQSKYNIKLLLVGDGPLKSRLQEITLGNKNIIFLPYQNDKNFLAKILASSDIYLNASPHETFGLSVLEAQASGLSVIGVKAGAMVERVNSNIGLLAEPDNAIDFASKIALMCRSDYKCKGAYARRLVENNYNWENTFKKILFLYSNMPPRQYFKALKLFKANRYAINSSKMQQEISTITKKY